MLKTIATVLVLAGLAAPAVAQNVYGSGGGPCQNWTANQNRKWQHLADVDWLMGYLSGVNRGRGPGSRLLGETNVQAASGFVAQFCAANPSRPIFEAADALIIELQGPTPR